MRTEFNTDSLEELTWNDERTSQILVRKRSMWPRVLAVLTVLFLLAGGCVIGVVAWFSGKVPPLHKLSNYQPWRITTVHDEEDNLIAEWAEQRRRPVPLTALPKHLLDAVVAAEDKDFYDHEGLDYSGIARAFWKNLWRSKGSPKHGGSTITQQVVKTFLLTRKQVYTRKIKEAILARRLEQNLKKDEILYLYLNQIYFGNGCYGVEEAARFYFGKSVKDLTLGESAIIAGIPKHPKRYNPSYSLPDTTRRRNYVLEQMYKNRYISYARYNKEKLLPVYPPPQKAKPSSLRSSDFVNNLQQLTIHQLVKYNQRTPSKPGQRSVTPRQRAKEQLFREGLKLETTLRPNAQRLAQQVISQGIIQLEQSLKWSGPPIQGAFVAIEPHTRRLLAVVEGRKGTPKLRRATGLFHPPGSLFLPVLYAAALQSKKYNAASMIHSGPIKFIRNNKEVRLTSTRSPRPNQPIRLRQALAYGSETAALRVMDHIGKEPISQMALALGIDVTLTTPESMGQGTLPVTLLSLTNVYATFAARGAYDRPGMLTRIMNRKGKPIYERMPSPERKVGAGVSQIMVSLLRKTLPLKETPFHKKLMGYADLSHDKKNAWWVSCSPTLCIGIWLGFDSPQGTFPLNSKATDLVKPLALNWLQLYSMDNAGKLVAPPPFPTSEDVVTRFVHKLHGWQVSEKHPQAMKEYFLYNALPPLSPSPVLQDDE